MGVRDDILSTIANREAIVKELEKALPTSRSEAERVRHDIEIKRQKQEISNLRYQWQSLNPKKR